MATTPQDMISKSELTPRSTLTQKVQLDEELGELAKLSAEELIDLGFAKDTKQAEEIVNQFNSSVRPSILLKEENEKAEADRAAEYAKKEIEDSEQKVQKQAEELALAKKRLQEVKKNAGITESKKISRQDNNDDNHSVTWSAFDTNENNNESDSDLDAPNGASTPFGASAAREAFLDNDDETKQDEETQTLMIGMPNDIEEVVPMFRTKDNFGFVIPFVCKNTAPKAYNVQVMITSKDESPKILTFSFNYNKRTMKNISSEDSLSLTNENGHSMKTQSI